jgi:hypothetical protein
VNHRIQGSALAALVATLAASPAMADSVLAPPAVQGVVPFPAAPPSAVPAPTAEELRHRRVVVSVDSTRPNAIVERRISVKEELGTFIVLPYKSTDATWEQVCVTPCSVDLDRFSSYRVSAQNRISASRTFTLPQGPDALHLRLRAGDLRLHRGAQVMSGVGLTALIVGASLLVTASDFRHPGDAREAGAIVGGAGLVLAAVGIPGAYMTRTRVRVDDTDEIANVYWYSGHKIPFLPEVNLGHGFTLTQRGVVFSRLPEDDEKDLATPCHKDSHFEISHAAKGLRHDVT